MSDNNLRVYLAGNQVCMKRGLDAARMTRYFLANGCIISDNADDADLMVALTCAFMVSYVRTAIDMIGYLRKHHGRLIVAGCLPAMAPEQFKVAFSGDHIVTKDFEYLDRLFPSFTVPYRNIPDAFMPHMNVMKPFFTDGSAPIDMRNSVSEKGKPPVILRIGEGCNNSCSYCSHPVALGPLKSKQLDTCIQDYNRILAQGHSRVSIHANDPGAYGLDNGSSYPMLLHKLQNATASPAVKWNLLDINPRWLLKYREELQEVIRWNRVAAIGVPMQSGSQRILKLMNRSVPIPEVLETLFEFRKSSPGLSIATHLIAGFPGETREEMEMSIDIFRKVKIDLAYIFPFSSNPHTKANKFDGKLTSEEIAERQGEMAKRISEMGVCVNAFA